MCGALNDGMRETALESIMKKLMLSLAALAALSLSGGAWADAECQAGSAYGTKPGCGPVDAPGSVPPAWGATPPPPNTTAVPQGHSGAPGYYPPGYYPPAAAIVLPQILQSAPAPYVYVDPRTGIAYAQNDGREYLDRDRDGIPDYRDRDRDGDGVRNSRDRYPDDPRWR